MNGLKIFFLLNILSTFLSNVVKGQTADSIVQTKRLKIEHAEPLYIDLIRDLGAHKGEKEWNIGAGLTDKLNYDQYNFLVEYEWAPIDRLGLEIEVPFLFYSPNTKEKLDGKPANRMESLKTAFQYTFLVSERMRTSMAIGYINELEFYEFNKMSSNSILKGNLYNPFLVVAKRLGSNFHSLIYTGPFIEKPFHDRNTHWSYHLNTNFHYMLPSSRNFIGLEINKSIEKNNFDMVLRPQMRLSIADNLLIGIVTGIPISKNNERLGTFLRLIYEPAHRHFKPHKPKASHRISR